MMRKPRSFADRNQKSLMDSPACTTATSHFFCQDQGCGIDLGGTPRWYNSTQFYRSIGTVALQLLYPYAKSRLSMTYEFLFHNLQILYTDLNVQVPRLKYSQIISSCDSFEVSRLDLVGSKIQIKEST